MTAANLLTEISHGVRTAGLLIEAQAQGDQAEVGRLLQEADGWTMGTLLAVFHNTVAEMSRGNKRRYQRAMRHAAASVGGQEFEIGLEFLRLEAAGELPSPESPS